MSSRTDARDATTRKVRDGLHRLMPFALAASLAAGGVAAAQTPPSAGESSVVDSLATATTRHATPGGATAGACDSWADACDLQTALAVAASGDEIWVATGVHKPADGTNRSATFQLKGGVALYGGFVGTETARDQRNVAANVTVLSGDIDSNDVTDANGVVTDPADIQGDNAYSVVTCSGADAVVLDGFTVTAGHGGESTSIRSGGGMLILASNPTVANVIFIGSITSRGGGMAIISGSPTLSNVTFRSNVAYGYGGGLHASSSSSPTLGNVVFMNNSASGGGGMMSEVGGGATLTDVTFAGNHAGASGGGMYSTLGSQPVLTNVTFSNNDAAYFGGGMYDERSSPVLTNVTFANNASSTGGGLHNYDNSNPILANVTFASNAAEKGGAIGTTYCSDCPSVPRVYNTIFLKGETGDNCYGAFAADSTNNMADDASCGSSATQSDSMNLGTLGDYGGNTQTIPLLQGSSAIDAADAAHCPATDQRGMPRPYPAGGLCDVGAFELSELFLPLKAYYPFSGNADDASGNGMNGVNHRGTLTSDRDGNPDSAYHFNGQAYIDIPGSAALNGMQSFTLSAWINTSVKDNGVVLSKVSPNRDFVLSLSPVGGGSVNAQFAHGGTYYHCWATQPKVPVNTWTHLAAVWTGSAWRLYINGALASERLVNGPAPLWTGTSFQIGALLSSYGRFVGAIDEVRIHSKALSENEIAWLMSQ
jgi:hypothetical protein